MYCLNQKDSFSFVALFLIFWLLSLNFVACSLTLFRSLPLFSTISKFSLMILLTSIRPWLTLSMFSCAPLSLNSFLFLFITFSFKVRNKAYRILRKRKSFRWSLFWTGSQPRPFHTCFSAHPRSTLRSLREIRKQVFEGTICQS